MPKTKISAEDFARQAVESIINGNASSALDEVNHLPKKQAMVVIAYMIYHLPSGSTEAVRFLRMLEIQAS